MCVCVCVSECVCVGGGQNIFLGGVHVLWEGHSHLQNRFPVEARAAHVHHAVAGHGCRGGIVNVVGLEDDLAVWRHGDAVAVSQCERFVVVQHRVQILNPDGIHGTVQDQPDVFS